MVYIVLYLNVIVFPEKSSGKRMINNAQMFNCNSNLSISYYILTFRQYLHPSILVVEVRRALFLKVCSCQRVAPEQSRQERITGNRPPRIVYMIR